MPVKFLLELSKMNSLILLPAVDIAHGQSVRLVKGDLASETIYGEPEAQAQNLVDAGASWIHLVDLDQAYGVGTNLPLLTQVVKNINTNFQISGGIKDSQTLLSAVTTGATRFNLSTAALLDLPWVESAVAEYGNTLTIGLDIQADLLVARGTKEIVGNLWEVLATLEQFGSARYVVTDIDTDGALSGPNFELLEKICAKTSSPVIASGGVATIADLETLRNMVTRGIEGAIIGQALYAGAFTLEEALAVAGVQTVN